MMSESLYDIFTKMFGSEVKPREGNNIRLVCPQCNHNSLSCNIQSGILYCFHCEYGKGLKFSGAASGFVETPVDDELHVKVTNQILEVCTLLDNHKDYLIKRGIYSPEKYKIKSAPFRIDYLLSSFFTPEELVLSGYFHRDIQGLIPSKALTPRRILIPFWSGDRIIGLKSRANPLSQDDELRYICPKGTKIKDKVWYKGTLGPDLIITEGELSAIASCEAGISCLGVPGLGQISSQNFLSYVKKLIKSQPVKRSFIILDTDPNIKNDKTKLEKSVALYKALTNSCVVYLPQDKEDECMDLDLYLSRYGVESLQDILEDMWPKRRSVAKWLGKRIEELNGQGNKGTSRKDS